MQLNEIFKAYDIRGTVPDQLDEEAARRVGAAFARFAGAPRIAVGRDCRDSSPGLAAALIEGIAGQGVDVDGALLLRAPDGTVHRLLAADISLRPSI